MSPATRGGPLPKDWATFRALASVQFLDFRHGFLTAAESCRSVTKKFSVLVPKHAPTSFPVHSVTSRDACSSLHPNVKFDTPPGSSLFRVVTSMALANLEQSRAVGCVTPEKREQPFAKGMAEID
jgi:hypothetical protein